MGSGFVEPLPPKPSYDNFFNTRGNIASFGVNLPSRMVLHRQRYGHFLWLENMVVNIQLRCRSLDPLTGDIITACWRVNISFPYNKNGLQKNLTDSEEGSIPGLVSEEDVSICRFTRWACWNINGVSLLTQVNCRAICKVECKAFSTWDCEAINIDCRATWSTWSIAYRVDGHSTVFGALFRCRRYMRDNSQRK